MVTQVCSATDSACERSMGSSAMPSSPGSSVPATRIDLGDTSSIDVLWHHVKRAGSVKRLLDGNALQFEEPLPIGVSRGRSAIFGGEGVHGSLTPKP